MIWAAFVALSLSYCVPTYLMFLYVRICFSKPCWRWSVVLMPGCTETAATVPLKPIARARAIAACLPPSTLSEEMLVNASGLGVNVTTVATGMPALIAFLMGAMRAVLSVGAIRIASGFRAIAAFRMGIWVGAENAVGEPWNVRFTPSFLAAARAPLCIV